MLSLCSFCLLNRPGAFSCGPKWPPPPTPHLLLETVSNKFLFPWQLPLVLSLSHLHKLKIPRVQLEDKGPVKTANGIQIFKRGVRVAQKLYQLLLPTENPNQAVRLRTGLRRPDAIFRKPCLQSWPLAVSENLDFGRVPIINN